MDIKQSHEMFKEMERYMPSGVNSNSRYSLPHPLYYQKGEGAYLTDVDGNEYLDIVLGNGALILGHHHEAFMKKYIQYLESGIITGVETPLSIKVAKKFLEFVPSMEQVRFSNTGTEAVLHAIMMARTYTNKQDVAVIEGAYNGWSDVVNVSTWADLSQAGDENQPVPLAGSKGLNQEIVESTVVIPFNNLEVAEKLLIENKDRLAALVLEPTLIDIGYIEGKKEYLEGLRKICTELNIVLIFDELLTGFREAKGGYQERIGVTPDLSTFGKAIANGFPLSAVAGKRAFMQISEVKPGGYTFVGTYNGHQSSLAAALAFFEVYEEENVLGELDKKTNRLISSFQEKAKQLNIDGHMVGKGGHIHWYFTKEKPENYREAARNHANHYKTFIDTLKSEGIYCLPKPLSHHAISLAHGEEELRKLEEAMDKGLQAIASLD